MDKRNGTRTFGLVPLLIVLIALICSAPTQASIAYVQGNAATPDPLNTFAFTFDGGQTAGNLNVIAIGWSDDTSTITSIVDSAGNSYVAAAPLMRSSGNASQVIYYAKNIASALPATNTVTITFSGTVSGPSIRWAEYAGIDTVNALDVSASQAGNAITSDSGSTSTTNANDLLIGANYVSQVTQGPGTGFTQRLLDAGGQIFEDRIVSAVGSYSATAPLEASGWWIMQMAAFRAAATDTQLPGAPTALAATPVSGSAINLSWTASTDNVSVTEYRIERCQGSGCSSFTQIDTVPVGTKLWDTGLSASTNYSYRVRASDAASNLSAYSSTVSATTLAANAGIAYVQGATTNPGESSGSLTLAYAAAQTAGNLNVVAIGWYDDTVALTSVTDSAGNTYALASGPTISVGNATHAIYYAKNIAAAAAGANTITITFAGHVWAPSVRAAEYSGLDTANPLQAAAGSIGIGGTSATGSLTTQSGANELLVAGNYVSSTTAAPGFGYKQRLLTAGGEILEDRIVSVAGSYLATASLSAPGWWIMNIAAFRAASAGGDTQSPTAPTSLAANAVSSTQIDLSWTASTDNVGVTGYRVERCQGASCTTFAQIATPSGTSYSDTGLTGSTTYRYRISAVDAAGNTGSYSSIGSASTSSGGGGDTQAPTNPTGLTATTASSSQINLTWTASTDNVGVSGYRVERCQGVGCSAFTQIGTPTGTTFSDTGLSASTTYSYRVRAADAVPNMSGYSAVAAATTSAVPDVQAPTAPSGLAATAISGTQIDLSWAASTDNVAVTGYLIERCQGTGCTSFSLIGTVAGTSYSDTSLAAATTYRYRVRATDAASNLGPYSNIAATATSSGSGKAGSVTYQYDSFGRLKQVTVSPE